MIDRMISIDLAGNVGLGRCIISNDVYSALSALPLFVLGCSCL